MRRSIWRRNPRSGKWKYRLRRSGGRFHRARERVGLFKGVQLLWVDDHPENNLNERRMFRQLGVDIDSAKSTEEALAMLAAAKYDVVLSDMARGDHAVAGLDLLREMQQRDIKVPVIFYMGSFDADKGVPPRAFGATNRPDELLHLTLDVLERRPADD
jgi:CheY-like chemotaxis protein